MIRKLLIAAAVIVVLLIGGLVTLYMLFGRPAPTPTAFANALAFDEAAQLAAEQDRPVLVFASADWCIPCQMMKRSALADERVERAIGEKTVPVYLDLTDRGNETARQQAESLKVGGIPALVLVRDGEVISRLSGMRSADDLLSWLDDI